MAPNACIEDARYLFGCQLIIGITLGNSWHPKISGLHDASLVPGFNIIETHVNPGTMLTLVTAAILEHNMAHGLISSNGEPCSRIEARLLMAVGKFPGLISALATFARKLTFHL